ncbi:flagellar hook-associated protein FlgL [Tumebacillus flagellatus]|nr:flagellar hook-associated protein FlgL [Tumebacillus flagellatus]
MRITQSMMNNQFMHNLNLSNERMNTYQEVLSSGLKLNRPSDDPVGVGYAMRYTAQLAANDQYVSNASAGQSQLEYLDTTLGQINEVLQRAKELAVQGASGSVPADARKAIGEEMDQLYKQLVDLSNSQFSGRYIFNGQKTDTRPYDLANAMYQQTDDGVINYQMSEGVSLQVNVNGDEVFGPPTTAAGMPTSDNLFAVMRNLTDSLNSSDAAGIASAMDKLETGLNRVLQVRSSVGARSNRLELIQNRLKDVNLNVTTLLSKTTDADIAQTITDMTTAQSVQRAAMASGTRIIQPTLVDYLR